MLVFLSVIDSWCSIKNDYRTLVGLEDVNVVETYTDIEEANEVHDRHDRKGPQPEC